MRNRRQNPTSPTGPDREHQLRRKGSALALVLALVCGLVTFAVPGADAAPRRRPPATTTTTKAPTTTTTVAPTTTTTAAPTTTTTVAPTTTTTAPAPLCGATVAKPGGGVWECTFAEEFDGTTLDPSKWVVQETAASGFTSGSECFVNQPGNVAVADGVLSLTVRKEAQPFVCATGPLGDYVTQYSSGMVSTWNRFSQAYGRFEVRAKFPAATVKGLQSALWLYPQSLTYGAWPASGEIDIAESYSAYPDRAIPYVHYNAANDPNVTNNYCMIADISQLHSYVVEWTPETITVIFDGTTCLVDTYNPAAPLVKPQPFDQPFFVALTQGLGIGGNAFDPATTPLPATTQVDFVHVWK
jgi:beta-glucanase (GH16 family)